MIKTKEQEMTIDTQSATGGHIWENPKIVAARMSPSEKLKRIAIATIRTLLLPMSIAGLLMIALATVTVVITTQNLSEKMSLIRDVEQAYVQEYGYTDIDSVSSDTTMVTVIATGVEKEVNVAQYKGVAILYETQAQLEEKMAEADAGTYEVLNVVESYE